MGHHHPDLRTDRLAVRLALLLAIALLPVGAIAVWQTATHARDSDIQAKAVLVQRTAESLAPSAMVIEALVAKARAVGRITLAMEGDCSDPIRAFVTATPQVEFGALVEPGGETIRCSSGPSALPPLASDVAGPILLPLDKGPASGDPSLLIAVPMGQDRGFSVLVAPVAALESPRSVEGVIASALADRRGQPIVTWMDRNSAGPAPSGLFISPESAPPDSFEIVTPVGSGLMQARVYWSSAEGDWASPFKRVAGSLIFPGLMWIISLSVAFGAVYRMAVRPIRALNSSMRRFALGQRDGIPMMQEPGSAGEIREMTSTFNRMARIIIQDEAELTAALREKSVLLREVHHRVKNNFQLVSSVINLQYRRLTRTEARIALRSIQERVLGLAAIHHAYYTVESIAEARADQLLRAIVDTLCAQAEHSIPQSSIHAHLEPSVLAPDQIVPLSAIVAELINDILQAGQKESWLEISIRQLRGGLIRLELRGPAGGDPAETDIRAQLLETLALQIEGRLDRESEEDPRGKACRSILVFPSVAPARQDVN